MFDWTSDPDTLWLNVTNVVLGLCVLVCVGVAVLGIARDLMAKAREKAKQRDVFVYDSHAMMMPDLGMTMADGGEPISKDQPKPKKS